MLPHEVRKTISNKGASRDPKWPAAGEGTSTKPGGMLGPRASVMASAVMAEKILAGVILPADREKVDKLSLDEVVTKLLHVLIQVFVLFHFWFFVL